MSMSLLLGWGAYARDKNTSARLCAKKVGGGLMRNGGRICGTLRYCPWPIAYICVLNEPYCVLTSPQNMPKILRGQHKHTKSRKWKWNATGFTSYVHVITILDSLVTLQYIA